MQRFKSSESQQQTQGTETKVLKWDFCFEKNTFCGIKLLSKRIRFNLEKHC